MRRSLLALGAIASVLTIPAAEARIAAPDRATKLPAAIWAVDVDARTARALTVNRLRALRRGGINIVVADRRLVGRRALASLRRRAARAGLRVAVPARRTARISGARIAVIRVRSPRAAAGLGSGKRRVLALARLSGSRLDAAAWRRAIATARSSRMLDLGVSPRGAKGGAALNAYLALLAERSVSPPTGPPRPPQPPPPPQVPDRPASVFLSPAGSDSNPCSRAAPCRSLDRAYRVARPGEFVELAGGSYPTQDVNDDPSKTSEDDVVFRPAAGAAAVFGGIDVFGDHVEFRGIQSTQDFYVKCGADDVTLRNSKAALFFIRSATDVSFVDVEFGPSDDISQIGHTEECQFSPDRILMERVYMHDFTHPDPSVHMECLTVQAANNLTIRNSRFHHCEDFDILLKHRVPVLRSDNMLFENNWFDKPWPDGSSAIQFSEPDSGGTYANVTIRNNSFNGTLLLKSEVGWENLRVHSNVGTRYGGFCDGRVTSAYNVWSGTSGCSATDLRAATGFVNQSGFDFHLAPGSPAIDSGHPTDFPGVDIDGEARPKGGRADAGADER